MLIRLLVSIQLVIEKLIKEKNSLVIKFLLAFKKINNLERYNYLNII
jgi:hypothetical protein